MAIRRNPEDFVVEERPVAGRLEALRAEAAVRTDVAATESDGASGPPAVGRTDVPGRADGASGEEWAVYRVVKKGMTTPEVVSALSSRLGLGRGGGVDYAGLKDRHAVTTQWVSVPTGGRGAEAGAWPVKLEGSGGAWTAELAGFSDSAWTAECIEGNRFAIVVRGLSRAASEMMHARNGLLAVRDEAVGPGVPRRLLVVNYFGAQRFGSARHGRGFAGRELIRGDFEAALKLLIGTPARKDVGSRRVFTRMAAEGWGDWKRLARELPAVAERGAIEALAAGESAASAFTRLPNVLQQMSVEAYQSHLWNAAARRVVNTLSGVELIRAADRFGEMVFAPAAAVPRWMRTAELAMPAAEGRGAGVMASGVVGAAMEMVLEEEGLRMEDLRVPTLRRPRFKSVMRQLMVEAEGFSMSRAERELEEDGAKSGLSRRVVKFGLPRGSYATVVLRALGQ